MQAIIEFLRDNTVAAFWLMAAIVFIITQLIKWPIKVGTKKLDEAARKNVNTVILLLPFALGVTVQYLYCAYIAGIGFDVEAGIKLGTASMSFYGIADKLLNIKVNDKTIVDALKLLLANGGAAIKKLFTVKAKAKTNTIELSDELLKFLEKIGEGATKASEAKEESTGDALQDFLAKIGK